MEREKKIKRYRQEKKEEREVYYRCLILIDIVYFFLFVFILQNIFIKFRIGIFILCILFGELLFCLCSEVQLVGLIFFIEKNNQLFMYISNVDLFYLLKYFFKIWIYYIKV